MGLLPKLNCPTFLDSEWRRIVLSGAGRVPEHLSGSLGVAMYASMRKNMVECARKKLPCDICEEMKRILAILEDSQ
jgi:hypothetical protein